MNNKEEYLKDENGDPIQCEHFWLDRTTNQYKRCSNKAIKYCTNAYGNRFASCSEHEDILTKIVTVYALE